MQRVTLRIIETHDLKFFEHQRGALLEHDFALRLAVFDLIAQFNRPHLLAGNGRIGGVFASPSPPLIPPVFARLI
ncbi:Uncharacterised protein [Leclercia adecarboxylata]|uniref:Uncharacterized protein n=1 Tax=Leclercia adecarboxylata TaxID=83655 RepID=A0A4U9HHV5_9ENTR|nr:Uncharacterised protein [Leclercia adecarboxylata]